MNKSNQIKGKGHHNKLQMTTNTKNESKKKDDDSSFVYNLGILIGCVAEIETIAGEKFEGVLSAFTQQNLKIMIEAAHEPTEDDESSITKHYDLLLVPAEKISVIRFRNAEVSYATRDFQTDSVISAGRQVIVGDKELTPWDGADDDLADGLELDSSNQNGWEAQDMFKKNEEKYGVKTTFKDDLSGYTTQIDKTDTESLKKHEEQAAQVAKEIENNTSSWDRTKLENGEDEEEAFSAVVRPGRNSSNHSNNNASQNSNSGGSDKYVPPSRRQQQQNSGSQMSQNHPMNNNGPQQVNNTNQSNNRKSSYGGGGGGNNQNPRNNYGAGSNSSYHERRNNYDRPRGPPQNQYGHAGNHGDGRRVEENNRQPRMGNKGPGDRDRRGGGGRDAEQAKLKHFQDNFRLQENSQQRMRVPPHQGQHSGQPINVHGNPPPANPNSAVLSSGAGIRNPSPPTNSSLQISSSNQSPVKPKKDEFSPVPPLIQPSGPASTNSENSSGSGTDSPRSSNNNASANSTSPSPNISTTAIATAVPADAPGPASVGSVPESQNSSTVGGGNGDSKSNESEAKSKKTFTFNPNAKEFNPNPNAKVFQPQRSPSTPPRPPSTPASTPQQLMQAPLQPMMPFTVPPQPLLYAHPHPPPHYAAHAQAALTPSSNSSASSGGNTPRQRHPKGIMSVQSRPDMTPPMQMAAGPPLSIQPTGPPPFAYVQSGYSQIMRLPQGVMPVYQTDGSGQTHLHPSMQYIHHNGATAQSNTGHQSANQPQSNPLAQAQNVPSNGHAYGQATGSHGHPHMGYAPLVTVPMVYGVSNPGGHQIVMPYVPHQGGNNAGIPHSQ